MLMFKLIHVKRKYGPHSNLFMDGLLGSGERGGVLV